MTDADRLQRGSRCSDIGNGFAMALWFSRPWEYIFQRIQGTRVMSPLLSADEDCGMKTKKVYRPMKRSALCISHPRDRVIQVWSKRSTLKRFISLGHLLLFWIWLRSGGAVGQYAHINAQAQGPCSELFLRLRLISSSPVTAS